MTPAAANTEQRDVAAVPQRKFSRTRTVIASVLIVFGALLAPVAVVANWVRAELVSTEQFVATFAPLIEHAAVQDFIADRVVVAIDGSLDIDSLVADAFSGVQDLGLGPRASNAIGLLEGPAAEGIRSMIRTTTDRVVSSDEFARVWSVALQQSHARATSLLRGDPGALQLSDSGTVSIEIGPIVSEVRTALIDRGMRFASEIPDTDRSIPVMTSDSLATARTVYQVAMAAGAWLPIVALGLVIVGVIVAVRKRRATLWAGLGIAASLGLLAAGLGTGKLVFVREVSPVLMPAETAEFAFGHLTSAISALTATLIAVSLVVAAVAWLSGTGARAVALRGAATRVVTKQPVQPRGD